MGWQKIKDLSSSDNDETEQEQSLSEVASAAEVQTEIRGKDIDLAKFEESDPGQGDQKDSDLYDEFKKIKENIRCTPF